MNRDTPLEFSKGLSFAMQAHPELRGELDAMRRAMNEAFAARYGSFRGYLEGNREAWRERCRQLSPNGDDPDAVPFLWEPLLTVTRAAEAVRDNWKWGVAAAAAAGVVRLARL